jgi:hypothetical protein
MDKGKSRGSSHQAYLTINGIRLQAFHETGFRFGLPKLESLLKSSATGLRDLLLVIAERNSLFMLYLYIYVTYLYKSELS